jgi:septum formation protein
LEKPDSTQEAREMLYALSGCSHAVLTGIALAGPGAAETVTHCEETKVHFRELEAWEIDWYIRSGEYADKAGAYGIQGKAAIFVRSIEGCYFNVVGLPLTALFMLMKERDLQLENYLMF